MSGEGGDEGCGGEIRQEACPDAVILHSKGTVAKENS